MTFPALQLVPGYSRLPIHPVHTTLSSEQVARFATIFADAWSQIPPGDQGKIIAFWDMLYVRNRGEFPRVELWSRELSDEEGIPLGRCHPAGVGIDFDIDRILSLPDAIWPRLVIAHELAHVFLHAVQDSSHSGEESDDDASRSRRDAGKEAAVEARLALWGFNTTEHNAVVEWWRRGTARQQLPS